MKITCPFCKTDYAAKVPAGRRTECAVCSHCWVPPRASVALPVWVVAAALILAAALFTGLAIIRYMPAKKPQGPLAIEMVSVRQTESAAGAAGWTISGRVSNLSGNIHGVPDLILVVKNDQGDTVLRQRMSPPMPILDIGESATFTHTVQELPDDARRVTMEFRR